VADPDVVSDGDVLVAAPLEKILVILAHAVTGTAVGEMMLGRPQGGGVVAGIDANEAGDGTEFADGGVIDWL
jgi:hypothetical protein